ncbi:MAG TPA: ATP-binding protein [Noviherbaspirillum sp.]
MTHQLPDSKDLALAIAENSVHGLVVMDENGYCLYANRAWLDMTGFSAEEMQEKAVHDLVHHHYPDGRPFPIDECPIGCTLGKNQTVRNHHDVFFRKDGTSFHVSCAASPVIRAGSPILMVLEIRDITEEKESDRRKDEFLAMLAHELRNPLAPIAAAAELLGLGHLGQQRVAQTAATISRQVAHITGLVDDLLDMSRVTHGLISLHRQKLDFNQVVYEAVEQARPLIDGRRHRLAVHASPAPALILGDRKRLVQVMANILNNAAKYTPDGGEIVLRVTNDADAVIVTVSDNGIGMTQEMTERAFKLFTQAQRTADRAQGGLGIGLALVKSLVALHGGQVSAHSDGPGHGTHVKVSIPQLRDVPQPVAGKQQKTAFAATVAPLKILVVDDNVDAANMLAVLLQAMGHEVHVEPGPRKALEIARRLLPDVFLLDIGLPDMNGIELVRRLRCEPQHANALMVAVTGYGQVQDRNAAVEAGFDHHIIKPADPENLATLLRSYQAARMS